MLALYLWSYMNISNYFCRLCFCVLLYGVTGFSAQAQTLLDAKNPKLEVSRDVRIWLDQSNNKTIEDVVALSHEKWQPLTGPMSLGFTKAAVWLQFDYAALTLTADQKWLLELDQPLLQNVRMYWLDSTGSWQSQIDTLDDGGASLSYNYRRPVFVLPANSKDGQVWLRISTKTSMSSSFYVWRHDAFAASRSQESFLWGLVFGCYVFVILFYGMYSFWTRNRLHAFYTVYILGNFMAAWLTGNWSGFIGITASSSTLVLLLGVIISWINFFGTLFNLQLLGLYETRPQFSKGLLGLTAAIGVVGSAGVLMGHYSVAIPWVQSSVIAIIIVNVYLGVSELLKRNPNAPLFLWGFSVFYVGVVVRYLRNMGWLEPSFLTEHSYQIGSFVHMIIMSVGIFSSYNRLQKERNEAVALADAEHQQREQQASFLGLVSHELRTPLTIVSTAADNMEQQSALDPSAKERLSKIQRAAERMSKIIEGYLNTERLTGPAAQEAKQIIDVLPIARQSIRTAQEKKFHPIELTLEGEGNFKLNGDALQLQIAIDNLLSNALSHTTPGTPIVLQLLAELDFITITVTNQGEPIDPTDLPHVFERFYRGRNAKNRPGSGLGLHLVQVVAAMHNGHVLAENLSAGYCRFTLVLGRG